MYLAVSQLVCRTGYSMQYGFCHCNVPWTYCANSCSQQRPGGRHRVEREGDEDNNQRNSGDFVGVPARCYFGVEVGAYFFVDVRVGRFVQDLLSLQGASALGVVPVVAPRHVVVVVSRRHLLAISTLTPVHRSLECVATAQLGQGKLHILGNYKRIR
jgi:hypothetical protein